MSQCFSSRHEYKALISGTVSGTALVNSVNFVQALNKLKTHQVKDLPKNFRKDPCIHPREQGVFVHVFDETCACVCVDLYNKKNVGKSLLTYDLKFQI